MISSAGGRRHAGRLARLTATWLLAAALLVFPAISTVAATAPTLPAADVAHLVLSREGDSLGIFEMVSLMNEAADPTGPLALTLPEGAEGLTLEGQPEQRSGVVAAGNRVEIPAGLPANGRLELAFRYRVPAKAESLKLQVTLPFPIERVYVLTDAHSMILNPAHTRLRDDGVLDLGPKRLRQFIQEGVAAGEALQLSLQFTPDEDALNQKPKDEVTPAAAQSAPPGLLNRSFHGGAANTMLWQRVTGSPGHGGFAGMVAMVLTLALLITAIVLAWRQMRRDRRRSTPVDDDVDAGATEPVSPPTPRPELLRRRAELIRLAEELDRQRLAGEVGEEDHRRRREEIKRELVRVLVALKQSEG